VRKRSFLKALVAVGVLGFLALSPALGSEASVQERKSMSQSVADDIHDYPNEFRAKAVEIGAAVIEEADQSAPSSHYALADWRSADGTLHGQVFFINMCDHWNVEAVSFGRPLTVQEIVSVRRTPTKIAKGLLGELAGVDSAAVAYLKPSTPGFSC
jgi:hypothetical protein